MPDMEKVIKGLEHCSEDGCKGCPYEQNCKMCDGFSDLAKDALELLKEQKGVPYVFDADGETACGVCGYQFGKAYGNCPKCGKKVDWNA